MSDEARCPHCEVLLEKELFYDFEDGDSYKLECDNCKKLFFVRVWRSVSYDIQKAKEERK